MWAWAKQIDGYPDTEWTFTVFLSRLVALEGLSPQHFYEHASTYDDVLGLLHLQRDLYEAGVPAAQLPSVGLGTEWYESGFRAPDGRLPMPAKDEAFRGRHRIIASGWDDDGGRILFTNSWGDWGKDGMGSLSREYFEAYVDDVFVERPALWGPSPAADARLAELSAGAISDAMAKAWVTRNPGSEDVVLHNRVRETLARFTTYSCRGPLVDVAELRHADRPVGRCHLFHEPDSSPPRSVIEELFVLPRFRRRGFGTLLVRDAEQVALKAGSEVIEIALYEADARPRVEAVAVDFAHHAGYTWRRTSERRPNRISTASRSLTHA